MTTIYRNYLIARVGDKFVAQSSDDECLLVSSTQQRLHTAIDDLWTSLEKGVEPAWFSGSTAIDLDTFGPDPAEASADPPVAQEPAPVRQISPWLFALSAVAVSVPIALLLEFMEWEARADVIFMLGVCATTIAFGRRYALMLSAVALFVNNVFCVDPVLTFTIPTVSEDIFFVLNILAVYCIPVVIAWSESRRGAVSSRRTPGI